MASIQFGRFEHRRDTDAIHFVAKKTPPRLQSLEPADLSGFSAVVVPALAQGPGPSSRGIWGPHAEAARGAGGAARSD